VSEIVHLPAVGNGVALGGRDRRRVVSDRNLDAVVRGRDLYLDRRRRLRVFDRVLDQLRDRVVELGVGKRSQLVGTGDGHCNARVARVTDGVRDRALDDRRDAERLRGFVLPEQVDHAALLFRGGQQVVGDAADRLRVVDHVGREFGEVQLGIDGFGGR